MPSPVAPPAVTTPPVFPSFANRATYNADAYTWATALRVTFSPEIVAIASNIYNNASSAFDSAATAVTKAAEAAGYAAVASASAKISLFVAGSNYNFGDCVISLVNAKRYDCLLTGVYSADPSTDPNHWRLTIPETVSVGAVIYLANNFGAM